MNLRKKFILLTIGFAFFLAITATGIFLFWFSINPTIIMLNSSGQVVDMIQCTFLANGEISKEEIGNLEAGENVKFSKATSDFYILAVEYRFSGELRKRQVGGISCTTENLLLKIDDQGEIIVSYFR